MDAVKSEPPRPSVVVTPSSVDAMKPPMTTTLLRGERRQHFGQPLVGLREKRRGLGMPMIGDDHPAGIDMHRGQSEVLERQRHDVARQALAVTRDGVDGARRQFAEHRDSFDELGHLLKMVVERAVEFGAMRERDHLAGFAGMEVAQIVQLADVFVALAGDGGLGDGEEFVGGLAHRRDHHDRMAIGAAFTMAATRSMAAADSTEVPPNFITIMSVRASPSECISSALSTAAPAAPRIVLWPSATNFQSKTGQGRRRPTNAAMPRSRSASLRGCGRSASGMYCTGRFGALGRLRSCGTLEKVSNALRRSASRGLRRKLDRHRHGVAIDHRHAIAMRADLRGQRLDVIAREVPEDLLRLLLHLLFFAADERNHVAHDVHRRHARIARARDRLQGGRDDARDAELLQGREPHREHDGRAVGIGHDLPLPSARALLAGDQLQVIGIDFRHEQRHVAIHAVVLRIRYHHVPGLRERLLDFRRDGRVHGGKQKLRRVAGLRFFDRQRARSTRAPRPPRCHFAASE